MEFTKNKKIAAAVLGAGAVAIGGAGVAIAGSSDDEGSSKPVTGSALEKASAAAMEVTGPGEVTESEVGDEEGAYEIEITRPDGSKQEVHLDDQFNVIGSSDEAANEGNEANEGAEGSESK